ncbi:toxin-activating lysine-acyltransferase [uncultured Roseobacter sp.]|uniref:toxin-activating lysine-acyltransferase n=1 Tax=uncultured Roseobacter sp. TaxID=114847 RepID=UPI002628711D|nr:toxin-activating lysine-acyltransferase [uncultured Roseobacter sp.]
MDPQTFGSAMGQIVWLMTMSEAHRDLPIHEIEHRVSTPILLRQFKLYSKGNQPVAYLAWALVTDDVKARFDAGDRTLELKDWRAGQNLIIVDCVSPFAPRETIEAQFLENAVSRPPQREEE